MIKVLWNKVGEWINEMNEWNFLKWDKVVINRIKVVMNIKKLFCIDVF